MIYEAERVRLFVDGKQVADQTTKSRGGETVPGLLAFGKLASRELGCDGLVDEVRLSRGVRAIEKMPEQPFETDDRTLGLWHFDGLGNDGSARDESPLKNPARPDVPERSNSNAKAGKLSGHWGEDAVGFRWTEQDSVDNRWSRSEIGPFLASIVPLPDQPPVAKGLSIRVGEKQQATVCYDTATLTMRAAWQGGFLHFDPARFGLIAAPRPDGEMLFVSPALARSPADAFRYEGFTVRDGRVVFRAAVGAIGLLETPWAETNGDALAISRAFEIESSEQPVTLPLGSGAGTIQMSTDTDWTIATVTSGDRTVAFATRTGDGTLEAAAGNVVSLTVPGSKTRRVAKVLQWGGPRDALPAFRELLRASPRASPLQSMTEPGKLRWNAEIVTGGTLGIGEGPYVLDTLTLPFENPYRALLFVTGHDFFSNGDLAVCTAHGDVWRVAGVDDSLARLVWRRYATGLFQPLGLKIVDDRVHVLGRDQITRLHDRNSDGEADLYECFHQRYLTSPGGHDYVACLDTDAEGNFYFVHATQGLLKVSKNGERLERVATGFRNPNGMGIGPSNVLTVAPQEGEWTPASAIFEVRHGGYYGYGGPKITDDRPLGYDPPLCWIPRLMDNSSGGQVWVTSDRWGPLNGQMLHLSYGKCRMMLVPREVVDGQPQGGTVEFPLDFDSGICRGRFSPHDGQFYVSGLRGWASAAVQDGCLQRVRYTGSPIDMPVAVRTLKNGLALTFTRPLDRAAAERADSYAIQQWNYLYGKQYGSPEYRVSDPKAEGRDEVDVLSATLLDERTVFLEMADVRPVMQMSVACTIAAADGTPVRQTLAYTINRARGRGRVVTTDAARVTERPSRRNRAQPAGGGDRTNGTGRPTGCTAGAAVRVACSHRERRDAFSRSRPVLGEGGRLSEIATERRVHVSS